MKFLYWIIPYANNIVYLGMLDSITKILIIKNYSLMNKITFSNLGI